MWSVFQDFGVVLRLCTRLDRRVVAFHARYELGRGLLRRASEGGRVAPSALYVETSSFCRGACTGCYVPLRDRRALHRLDERTLRSLIESARRLRLDFVCIVGGEPLDRSIAPTNLALIRGAPDMRFLLCTGGNGSCDAELMRELAELRNLSVVFSIDGLEATHDRVRGRGSHARVTAAARAYAESGRGLSGASVTLREDTWEEATSEELLASIIAWGCSWVVFDPWFSSGAAPGLSPADMARAIERLRALVAASGALVFVNPFGRVRARGFDRSSAMRAAAVDYHGNVYGSRRGRPLGNVNVQDLVSIVDGDEFQASWRRLGVGGSSSDDPRTPMFEETLALLAAR